MSAESPPTPFAVGDRVRLASPPPYLKTADPMPMLRPAGVIAVGSEGLIQGAKLANTWVVRFAGGVFLVDGHYLESVAVMPVESTPAPISPAAAPTLDGQPKLD